MKETADQWLTAAQDDLRVVARIASDDDLTHMVAFLLDSPTRRDEGRQRESSLS